MRVFKRTTMLCIVFFLLFSFRQQAEATSSTGAITGSQTLLDDTLVAIAADVDTSSSGKAAVYAGNGEIIDIVPGKTVTIQLDDGAGFDVNSTQYGITAADGGEVSFGKTVIIAGTGGNNAGYFTGLNAWNGGKITIGEDSVITVEAGPFIWRPVGLFAYAETGGVTTSVTTGANTHITLNGDGNDAVAIYAENWNHSDSDTSLVSVVLGDKNRITLAGDYSTAISARGEWNDTTDTMQAAIVKTGDELKIRAGDSSWSYGVLAEKYSAVDIGKSADLYISGDLSHAFRAAGGHISAGDGLQVRIDGEASYAVTVVDGSINMGNDGLFTTSGDRGHAFEIFGREGTAMLGNNAYISTNGAAAGGIFVLNYASMDIGDGLQVYTSGEKAYGLHTEAYRIFLSPGDEEPETRLSAGDGARVVTSGDGAHAIYASLANAVMPMSTLSSFHEAGRSVIETGEGTEAFSLGDGVNTVWASGFNSYVTIGKDSAIVASGSDSCGVLASGSGLVTLHGGIISADTALGSVAIAAKSWAIIEDEWGDYEYLEALAHIISGDSTVKGDGQFTIHGDILAEHFDPYGAWQPHGLIDGNEGYGAAAVDMTLQDGSYFYGATIMSGDVITSSDLWNWPPAFPDEELQSTFINLTMNGGNTSWVVTRDSWLTNLMMSENAVIDYRSAGMGTVIHADNFGSSGTGGGMLIMKTDIFVGSADQLWVHGTTAGSHYVQVFDDLSGSVASEDTAVLIQTADTSGHFQLTNGNRVTIGAYDFELLQDAGVSGTGLSNDVTAGETGANWYLRGRGPSNPGTDGGNIFSAAYLLGYSETETLMKRLGDLRASPYGHGFWARVHGGSFKSTARSYVNGFDMDYGGVHVGYDLKLENIGWDGDTYAGVMFGYSRGDLDYESHGSGTVDSKMLGLYSTFTTPNGFFLDLILKYQWMENEFDSFTASGNKVTGDSIDTGGFGFSVEFGQRIPFGRGPKTGWYAEPQVQFSYMRQDGGTFNVTDGSSTMRVGADGFTSLVGRLGLLIGYETENSNFYAKISRAREFDGDVNLMINDQSIKEDFGGSFWVYGLGYTARLNDRNSIYLDVERTSGWSFRQSWSARLGWRIEF